MTGRFISTIAGIALIVTRCVFAGGNDLRVMHYKESGKWELKVNGKCKAFVTKFTSGSSSSPNPEAISFIKDAECNDDRSVMKETPISSLTDNSPLKKMISSFGMSESRIPPLTFKTHDISFYKIETNDGGIGLKVSGTMDATQKKDMRSNLKDTLASLKEQVLPTSVVAGSAHFLRFMHQKHRASRIRRHRMNSLEITGILMILFWAMVFCLIYCFGVDGYDDVDENREAATPWWLTIFANLIGHFEDAAGGDLELGNVDRVHVVPDDHVREISDVPTAVVDTTETFDRIMDRIRSLAGNRQPIPEAIMDRIRSLAGNRQPIPEATPVANTATPIEDVPEDHQLD